MWSAQDVLVLKYAALKIYSQLPLHPHCEHLRGHGGRKGSVERVVTAIRDNNPAMAFVCRTDIRGYYRNINKSALMTVLTQHVKNPALLSVLRQHAYYSVEDGGEFHTPASGIPRGCALSPLLGGALLYHIDLHFSEKPSIFYARYMDDFLLLSATRWSLRRVVKDLNQFFDASGFEQHPNKTQIGYLSRGLDWLGYDLNETGVVGVSLRALTKHREHCRRLYEQARWLGRSDRAAKTRVANYCERWRTSFCL